MLLFVMDGRTERLLRDEVSTIFTALLKDSIDTETLFKPYETKLSFRDYAISSTQITKSIEYKNALLYWESRLPELPSPPDLPLLNPDLLYI